MGAFFYHLPGRLVSFEGFLTLLTLGIFMLWRRGASRLTRIYLASVVSSFAIASIPLVPYGASRILGLRYAPLVAPEREEILAMVVLGAGSGTVIGAEQRLGTLSNVGASRVLEAARVHRLLKEPWLISSGGTARPDGETSAATMKSALVQLGVSPERILLESTSRDTHEEAVLVAPMLRRLGAERFALVTTRVHMVRAEAAFRAQGLMPIPAIVPDDAPLRRWWIYLMPTFDGLEDSGDVFHELIGLLYYGMRGW